MKVALVQNSPDFGKKEKNLEELFSLMNSKKANLYILPELAYTGYQFTSKEEVSDLADRTDSEVFKRFEQFSRDNDAAVIFGFAEKAADNKIYNSSVMITPEGDKHLYRKIHLYYKENLFFAPGNAGFSVYDWRGIKIGLAICFDWYFSESFRTLTLKGADLIAHCSNLVMPYCQTVDYARAIENRVFIATVNRIGSEERDGEKLIFTGQSVLVSPKGEYLVRAPEEKTGIFTTEINPELARDKKLNDFNNVLEDRRDLFYF